MTEIENVDENVDENEDAISETNVTEEDLYSLPNQPIDNQAKQVLIKGAHTVNSVEIGQRIDKLASQIWPEQSRAIIQGWLKDGQLTINDHIVKPKYRVKAGDNIVLDAKITQHSADQPEDIAIDVIYEDDTVLVINKPVGMVVHPGAGNWTGTLVNALLFHYPNQAHLPRAGLVHRIDKNTSGLLVVAKTKPTQLELQEQLKDKTVYRHYQCIVAGDENSLNRQRTIDAPIGRNKTQRTKMAVHSQGKEAVTHIVGVNPLNENYSLVDIELETGRTHQIRVHLSHIGHPIVGDEVYGKRKQLRAGLSEQQRKAILNFPRQALHAYQLGFVHPANGESIEVTAPMPEDMLNLIEILK